MTALMIVMFTLGILEVFFDMSVKVIRLFVRDREVVKNDYGFGVAAFFLAASVFYFIIKFMPRVIDFLTKGYSM